MSKKVAVIGTYAMIAVAVVVGFTLTSKSPAVGDVVRNSASSDVATVVDKDWSIKEGSPPKKLLILAVSERLLSAEQLVDRKDAPMSLFFV